MQTPLSLVAALLEKPLDHSQALHVRRCRCVLDSFRLSSTALNLKVKWRKGRDLGETSRNIAMSSSSDILKCGSSYEIAQKMKLYRALRRTEEDATSFRVHTREGHVRLISGSFISFITLFLTRCSIHQLGSGAKTQSGMLRDTPNGKSGSAELNFKRCQGR